jgi:lysyl-tRNA synthetase class II
MTAPKRFPDRVEVAAVRADGASLQPGGELDERRRVAGRVMARREMGKLVFLDLLDRSGGIQLMWSEPETAARHVPRAHRRRDEVSEALPRPPDERRHA